MRIAFDATYSLGPNLSGVGVYSRQILTRLPQAHPGPTYLFCYRPHRFPILSLSRRTLLWKDWPRNVDLFHALNQRVDSVGHRHVVSTFHDLFVITSDYSSPEFKERFARQAREAAERSDLIIAVSEFTASQVEELLGVERSRIRVVHHGVTIPPASSRALNKRILFVGAIQKRKNVSRLVEAFAHTPPGWKLTLAGSAGFGADAILQDIASSPRRADIELTGYVSDSALAELYQAAAIFAFPSLDEGFGIPVLEAMAYGIPVLTSNTSALAEVAGDAALLVDPNNAEEIAAGLNRLITDQTLRASLIQRGRKRAQQFSWEKAVEKTWKVYRELLG